MAKLPVHHYSPQFYLRQWASTASKRLIEFSRRYHRNVSVVVARDTYTAGTGYVRGLNIMENAPPHLREQFETVILQTVDGRASDALTQLKSLEGIPPKTKPRSAWTRFILSLMFRNPEALDKIRRQLATLRFLTSDDARAAYAKLAAPGAPDFDTYMQEDWGAARFQFALAMMNQPRLGEMITNMRWHVLTFKNAPISLLTSDRPVILQQGKEGLTLIMPMGPDRLFVAVHDNYDCERLKNVPPLDLMNDVNRYVVEHAVKYVWGADRKQLPFIEARLGAENANDLFWLDLERASRNLKIPDHVPA